ncbi:MAG: hypothetical protein GY906_31890 [bacterium]|nr:hypothetical protein [bacterium]
MYRCLVFSLLVGLTAAFDSSGAAILIDHDDTDITELSQEAMQMAKDGLHIAYGHTSYGSQLTGGLTGLVDFANGGGLGLALPNDFFAWNDGGTEGALDLHDYFVAGDLGSPDRTTWADRTRDYLAANSDVNVVIWSWEGQADTSEANIQVYLDVMDALEVDYPGVVFVYMTGHLVGTGLEGNLHLRNQQIRDYCLANGKTLYDFADIESYDPDGTYFGELYPDDSCDYDAGGGLPRANWATEWQDSHTEGVDWYTCASAHTEPLNANQKAYAAWALWTAIAVPEPSAHLLGSASLLTLFMIARACRRERP